MTLTRASVRGLVRGELQDTGVPPLLPDAVLHNGMAGAIAIYGRYWPVETSAASASTAGQTQITLPTPLFAAMGQTALDVVALTIDGVEVAQVPTMAVLREPAWPGQYSQTRVNPYPIPGAVASGWQAWVWYGGVVNLRYLLDAGHAIVTYYTLSHFLPTDDTTALTVPDADADLLVLAACDRAVRAMRVDYLRRGAPNARLAQLDDEGYRTRFADELARRRQVLRVRTLTQLQ